MLTHILAGVSLRLAMGLAAALLVATAAAFLARVAPTDRARLARTAAVGLLAGLLATAVYDAAKFALSRWDPSPYNPFEAIRTFGHLLAGVDAPGALVLGAGTAFHVLNGVTFGISYCFLLGRRGVWAGIGWGLALELFQLTLYPGWLDVRFYREFAQISALSHVAYGAVLGGACRYGLTRRAPQPR